MENTKELRKQFEKRNFYTTKDSGKVFLYALLLPFAIAFVFTYVSYAIMVGTGVSFEGQDMSEVMYGQLWFLILSMLLTEIVFICLFFCYNKTNRIKNSACNISFKKTNVWTCLLSAVAGIVSVIGFIWLIEGCFVAMFTAMGIETSSVSLPLDNVGWYFLNLLILAVVPAICEELIFRGMIFQGLKERFSKVGSVLLSALLFALMHQNIVQLIYPFILGCVLAVVMDRTNNLLYPMIIHFFNNFTTITISFLVNINAIDLSFNITWWFVLLAIFLAGLTCVVFWLLDKYYLRKHKVIEVGKTGEVTQTPALSVGKFPVTILCGIVFAVIVIVLNLV